MAFDGIGERLSRIHYDLENIGKKIDKIEGKMEDHSIKIGGLNKDVEYINSKFKESKEDFEKRYSHQKESFDDVTDMIWKKVDDKITSKVFEEKLKSHVDFFEEKIKSLSMLIWKIFIPIMLSILIKITYDFIK